MKQLFILGLLIIGKFSYSQQVGFGSLYHQDFGIVNSAFIGNQNQTSVFLNYRKQWISIPNSPEYLNGLLSLPLRNNKIGLGIQVHSHDIGMLKRQRLAGTYRYALQLNNINRLQFGVSLGIERTQIDLSRIDAQQMDEFAFYQSNQSALVGNFNVGLAYVRKNLSVGVSADFFSGSRLDFTNPVTTNTIGLSKVPTYNFQASYLFKLSQRWNYKPSLLVFSTQGLPLFADFSNQFSLDDKIEFGIGYRQLRSLNASFSFTFVNQLKVSYLYQHNLGQYAQNFSGSHEISLIFKLRNSSEEKTFTTSDRKAAELQEQMDASQRKIDELNRQLDSIYRKVANQDQQIAELKASQVSSTEIKELIDSLETNPDDKLNVIKLTKYEVINVSSTKDIEALLEDGTSTYQIVLGAFRNVEKARELNKTLNRDLNLNQEIVEIKVGEKSMYFVCLKEQYTSIKKAGSDLVAFKKAKSSQYAPYLNGEPWLLKMKR